jgi:hypothetical protein
VIMTVVVGAQRVGHPAALGARGYPTSTDL